MWVPWVDGTCWFVLPSCHCRSQTLFATLLVESLAAGPARRTHATHSRATLDPTVDTRARMATADGWRKSWATADNERIFCELGSI